MSALLLLLACADPGPWTAEAALAPTLVHLDTNHDGRVDAAEFDHVAFPSVPFSRVDTDGDGAVSAEELSGVMLSQAPDDFFVMSGMPKVAPMEPVPGAQIHESAGWQILESLRQEVAAARPDVPAPSAADVERAARLGLASPDGMAVLRQLQVAYAAAGLTFPPALVAPP